MTLTLPELFTLAVAVAHAAAKAAVAYLHAIMRQLAAQRIRHTALGAFVAMCSLGLVAAGVRPGGAPGV